MTRKRRLRPEEEALWKQVAESTRPLKQQVTSRKLQPKQVFEPAAPEQARQESARVPRFAIGEAARSARAIAASSRSGASAQAAAKAPAVERLMPAQQWITIGASRSQRRTKARSRSTCSTPGRTWPSSGSTMSLKYSARCRSSAIAAGRAIGVPTLTSVTRWVARVSRTVSSRRERGQTWRVGMAEESQGSRILSTGAGDARGRRCGRASALRHGVMVNKSLPTCGLTWIVFDHFAHLHRPAPHSRHEVDMLKTTA